MALRFDVPAFNDVQFEPLAFQTRDIILPQPNFNSTELDDKRLFVHRVEAIAQRYLAGQQIFIQTAELKGPFGENWPNPWGQSKRAVLENRGKKRKLLSEEDFQQSRLQRAEEKGSREHQARALQARRLARLSASPLHVTKEIARSRTPLYSSDIEVVADIISDHKEISLAPSQLRMPESHDADAVNPYRGVPMTVPEQMPVVLHEDLKTTNPAIEFIRHIDRTETHDVVLSPDQLLHIQKLSKTQSSLPTPSDSGNEDRRLLISGVPLPAGETARGGSSDSQAVDAQLASFTQVARAVPHGMSERKRNSMAKSSEMINDHICHPSQPFASQMSDDEEPADERVVSSRRRRNIMPRDFRSCFDCATQWRQGSNAPGTLCRGCDQGEHNRVRKDHSRKQEEHITGSPVLKSPTPIDKAVENKSSSDFALPCAPLQSTLPASHNDSPRAIYPPSKSIPQTTCKITALRHNKIIREMFSTGPLKDARDADKQLFALMGPRFTPHWDKALRRPRGKSRQQACHAKDSSNPYPDNIQTNQPPRSKPPLMMFDTPVALKNMRKYTRGALEQPKPNMAVTNKITEQPEGRIQNGRQVTNASEISPVVEGSVQQQDCLEKSGNIVVNKQSKIDLEIAGRRAQSLNLTLLDLHTNTILSADQVSPLRKLARRSASQFETNSMLSQTPDQTLEQQQSKHRDAEPTGVESVRDIISPYVSTQTAMLQAQFAFQEALDSPIRGGISTMAKEMTKTASTNIHRGYDKPALRSIETKLEKAHSNPDTQVLFDAFVFDTPQGLEKESGRKTDSRKRASFAMTPLGPREANGGTKTRTVSVKGCLKVGARQTQPKLNKPDKTCSIMSFSNMGIVSENTTQTETADFESYIEQAGSFLGDWDISSGALNDRRWERDRPHQLAASPAKTQ